MYVADTAVTKPRPKIATVAIPKAKRIPIMRSRSGRVAIGWAPIQARRPRVWSRSQVSGCGNAMTLSGGSSPVEIVLEDERRGRPVDEALLAARLADIRLPSGVATTFNIGRIGGGTAVNAIPTEAWMEVDLRSVDRRALATLDADFLRAVDAAQADEEARWGRPGTLSVVKERLGDRPAASVPSSAPIVQAAFQTTVTGASGNLGTLDLAADGSYTYTPKVQNPDLSDGDVGIESRS